MSEKRMALIVVSVIVAIVAFAVILGVTLANRDKRDKSNFIQNCKQHNGVVVTHFRSDAVECKSQND